ncbi:MAG: hypothetical protein ACRD3L_11965 [Terriglobales bacterium]
MSPQPPQHHLATPGRQLGMVTISYDEKLGIQALATTTPDRPPVVGTHPVTSGITSMCGWVRCLYWLDWTCIAGE